MANNDLDYMRFNQYMTKNPTANTANTGKFQEFLNLTPPNTGGGLANEGWGDKFSRWFTPNEKGTSLGGEVMSGIGTGVNVASGLAGMYFQNKQAGLAKDKANMEKDAYKRQVRADQENEARLQRLAKNVGNDAFYK